MMKKIEKKKKISKKDRKKNQKKEATQRKEFVLFNGTREQEIIVLKLLLPSDGAHPFKDTPYPLDVNFEPQQHLDVELHRSFLEPLYNKIMSKIYTAIQDLL